MCDKLYALTIVLVLTVTISFAQKPEIIINRGHSDFVVAINNSSDGKSFLTTSYDGYLKIFDTATKCEVFKEYFETGLNGAKFAAHDSLIVVFYETSLYVYSLPRRKIIKTIAEPDGIEAMDIYLDNVIYTTHKTGVIKNVALNGNFAVTTLFENFNDAIFLLQGSWNVDQALKISERSGLLVSVSGYSNNVVFYDLKAKKIIDRLPLHASTETRPKRNVCIDEQAQKVYVAMADTMVTINYRKNPDWKFAGPQKHYFGKGFLSGLTIIPERNQLAGVGPGHTMIYFFNKNGSIDTTLKITLEPTTFLISVNYLKDRQELVVGCSDGSILFYDCDSYLYNVIQGGVHWITDVWTDYSDKELMLVYPTNDDMTAEIRSVSNLKLIENLHSGLRSLYPVATGQYVGVRNDTLYTFKNTGDRMLYGPIAYNDFKPDGAGYSEPAFTMGFPVFSTSASGDLFYSFPGDTPNHIFKITAKEFSKIHWEGGGRDTNRTNLSSFSTYATKFSGLAVSPGGQYIVGRDTTNKLFIYTGSDYRKESFIDLKKDLIVDCKFKNDSIFYFSTQSTIYIGNAATGVLIPIYRLKSDRSSFPRILLATDNSLYFCNGTGLYRLQMGNDRQIEVTPVVENVSSFIFAMAFFRDQDHLIIGMLDNSFAIVDLRTRKITLTAFKAEFKDFNSLTENRVFILDDGSYLKPASSDASIFIKTGKNIYPLKHYDVFFNRPDKVLAKIDSVANKDEINFYRKLHEKKLKALGLTDQPIADLIKDLPLLKTSMKLYESKTAQGSQLISVEAASPHKRIKSIIVMVNGVSVPYSKQNVLNDAGGTFIKENVIISLSQGKNVVEVFCLNEDGLQSLRSNLYFNYVPLKVRQPMTYVISIAISAYKDEKFNLQTARKDGSDFLKAFKALDPKTITDSLFDEKVTENSIKVFLNKYRNIGVDDKLIIYYGGHGLLSPQLDYYLSCSETNFKNVSQGSILYSDFIKAVSFIPARHTLLFIDACHSGEIPKGYLDEIDDYNRSNPLVDGGIKYSEVINMLGGSDNFSGMTIVGSSQSSGYAFEDRKKNQSYLMMAIKAGLQKNSSESADLNMDGKITTIELIAYLYNKVREGSNGIQVPTLIGANPYNENWYFKAN